MEYAADDINIGYMSIILLINSENTLIDKLDKVEEIQPQYEHPIYGSHKGGVKFSCVLKSMPTVVEVTMNLNGNFAIHTLTKKGSTTFSDEPVDTLMNYLHIFYINMLDDENKLLLNALDKTSYRKIAKRMHYRENFGNDLSGD
jgi:hypothetical protein|tara:strand:+ start:239 stop:670 length:432 start_codon:yes stop_codon:yes gene_type:complete